MTVKAEIRTPPPGPKARSVIDVMNRNCYNSTFTYPLVIADGEGSIIRDLDGNSFIDFTSNIGTCPLGYSHPSVLGVLSKYSRNGAHKIAGQDFYCSEHAELSEAAKSIIPAGFKMFFVNSGAEAVENAIKLAYRKMSSETPSRLPGVSCVNAFHGRTLGALTYTFSKPVQKKGYPELPVLRIRFCSDESDPEIESIDKVLDGTKVAFVLTEVVQGEGGYNFASRRFIAKLRQATERHGVPLVLDEVQSGMGRTGRWWAFEHYGVVPDIMSAAKALQVGMAAYNPRYDPGEQGALSSTWGGGSRIDLAVGAATILAIREQKLLDNATAIGKRLLAGISDIAKSSKSGITGARGLGLMIGVEFESKDRRDAAIKNAFAKGLLLLPAGQKAVRVIPPLVISPEEADEGLELLEQAAVAG